LQTHELRLETSGLANPPYGKVRMV